MISGQPSIVNVAERIFKRSRPINGEGQSSTINLHRCRITEKSLQFQISAGCPRPICRSSIANRRESITREVSQLTDQIGRDIKKTNDPGEMGVDKRVPLFFPAFFPFLPSVSASPRRRPALSTSSLALDEYESGI